MFWLKTLTKAQGDYLDVKVVAPPPPPYARKVCFFVVAGSVARETREYTPVARQQIVFPENYCYHKTPLTHFMAKTCFIFS